MRCLLIKTKENNFFTYLKNKKQLAQYCKAFKAKMFLVKAKIKKNQILEIPKITSLICDENKIKEKIKFEIIEELN